MSQSTSAGPFTPDELERIGGAEELQVSSTRPDGTDRPFVTIWGVRVGDHLYIRSAYGTGNPWFRRAVSSGIGRIQAGGVDREVSFTRIDPGDAVVQQAVDAAFHAKYDRHGPAIVGTVVGPVSHEATLRLDPR
ncbi:DUF2255 family protein [Microbacterium cremeum]|uniref:DUF2255 family protein n=1 Tax=Microbacterium cremeum TaxID=2782169 RepID=UPI0018870FB2|nr:DUF2255 family protein [Microbacterium cremeum]